MKKVYMLPILAFTMLGMVGCADTESIPSDNLYRTIPEKNMPQYCKRQVAKAFDVYSGDIYLYPIEYHRGAKIIYGKYSEDSRHLKEFACIFNNNDTFAGIKMQHRNVKNILCYGE